MRITLIAAALIALPVLAACGDDKAAASPQVSQADLSKALQGTILKDPASADCAAKIFIDAGITQDGLRAMVNDSGQAAEEQTAGMSAEDSEKASTASVKVANECLKPQ